MPKSIDLEKASYGPETAEIDALADRVETSAALPDDVAGLVEELEAELVGCDLIPEGDHAKLLSRIAELEAALHLCEQKSDEPITVEIARIVRDRLEDGGGHAKLLSRIADDVARAILPIITARIATGENLGELCVKCGAWRP